MANQELIDTGAALLQPTKAGRPPRSMRSSLRESVATLKDVDSATESGNLNEEKADSSTSNPTSNSATVSAAPQSNGSLAMDETGSTGTAEEEPEIKYGYLHFPDGRRIIVYKCPHCPNTHFVPILRSGGSVDRAIVRAINAEY